MKTFRVTLHGKAEPARWDEDVAATSRDEARELARLRILMDANLAYATLATPGGVLERIDK